MTEIEQAIHDLVNTDSSGTVTIIRNNDGWRLANGLCIGSSQDGLTIYKHQQDCYKLHILINGRLETTERSYPIADVNDMLEHINGFFSDWVNLDI